MRAAPAESTVTAGVLATPGEVRPVSSNRERGLFVRLQWSLYRGEGSTIGETNTFMVRDAEGAGGRHYKTYRVYRLPLGDV